MEVTIVVEKNQGRFLANCHDEFGVVGGCETEHHSRQGAADECLRKAREHFAPEPITFTTRWL